MKEKYQINGSNTLFKVWGIILLVFTALGGIVVLWVMIMALVGSAMLPSLVDDYSPFMDSYSSTMMASASGYVMVIIIIFFLIVAAMLAVATMAGILLIRDYVKAKETLIVYAILYFVGALLSGIAFVSSIIVGAWAVWILVWLIAMLWRIATGVILLIKHRRSVPVIGTISAQDDFDPGPVPDPILDPIFPVGVIEGQFGAYQGRRSELYTGKLYKIGRESGCEIQVNHPKVSRIHCTVCKLPNGRYQITDCSSNGTFYDNIKLQKGIATEVNSGGLLVLGEPDNVLQLK